MSLRTLILHNFWLKLFSIALATVIWLAIHNSINSDQNLNQLLTADYIRVPITVQNLPGDKRVFRVSPDQVVVVALAKNPALLQASRKAICVVLDLSHFNSKESTTEEIHTEAPPGINILETIPSTVEVKQVSP